MSKRCPTPFLHFAALLLAAAPAAAYAPGSGTLFSEDFDGALDADWEQGNGLGDASPWTQVADGADQSFYADGYGPYGISPTRHWAQHFVQPTAATSFSIALELRAELGTGYRFHLDVEQRAPVPRKYRLTVSESGALLLSRTESGAFVQMTGTANGVVPANQKRWLRFGVDPGPGGHNLVHARIWSGGATAEPGGWTVEFADDLDTVARVHRFALDADGPKGIETWIDDLDAFGDPGHGVDSSVTEIWLVEMSHLDIGFTKPPDDIEAFAKTHLDQVLQNLDADPDYRWFIENGWWLDRWWERSTDAERASMVDHLRGGRLRLGAGYANLHTTVAGHEELTRSLYYSSRFGREHGVPLRTWVTDDVPGSTFALPEVLARSGVDFYVGGMNTSFGGRIAVPDHGDRPFWWVGPDGSRVLSWITFDSYAEAFDYGFSFFDTLPDLYRKLGKKLPEQEEVGYPYPELMLLRAFDNHYQGFHARDLAEQWNATYETPVFRLATPEEFFDHMLATYGPDAFPSYSGDFGAAWAPSLAGAPHTRDWVRRAHREGRAAEALLAAGSAVDGGPVPAAEVDLLYRSMLEVDEHSGAGGWPGYFTPEEMDRNNRIHLGYARDARDAADSLLTEGLDRTLAELPASGDAVAVVNPLGRGRDAWARIALPAALYATAFRVFDRAGGAEVPYQRFDATSEILFRAEGVPPFGYRVYDLVPGAPTATAPGTLAATATTLENDAYLLTIDPADGSVASLIEKATGRELVDGASPYRFNRLASNTKAQYDARNPPVAEPGGSATVTVASDGPLVAELAVTRSGTPLVETHYRLYRGEDRVEIENVLDRDLVPYVPSATATRAYMVTMAFDLHDFEIRSETTTRFLDPLADGFARGTVFDWHDVEHTLAFLDAAGGVLVASDAVTAYHFETLSSLAAPAWAHADALLLPRLYDRTDEYQYEDGSVGPFTMEPDTSPTLRFVHHLRAVPAAFDPVAASRFGFEALTPVETRLLAHRPGNLPDGAAAFVTVDAPGALPYTLKRAEDGDGLILRLTELTGAAETARVSSDVLALSAPERVEQDEDGPGAPLAVDGGGFLVDLTPYETATVRFRAAPAWSPIVLRVDKDAAGGAVLLSWSGGVGPYTAERAADAAFSSDRTVLVDEQPDTSHDDPVLLDGATYYYLVR